MAEQTCPLNHSDCPLTPEPPPKPPPKIEYFDLVLATLNVQRTLSSERALKDVTEVMQWPTPPTAIVLQEVQDRDSIFHSFNRSSKRWAVHHMGREHAILWRKDLLRSGKWGADFMCGGRTRPNMPNRYLAWNDFTVISTDQELTLGSVHTHPSIETNGKPRLTNPWGLKKMREHSTRFETWVDAKAQGRPVIVGGDWNVDYRRDRVHRTSYFPFSTMARCGMMSSYLALGMPSGGTHGNRLIDWWGCAPGGTEIRAMSHGIMRDFYTDHHGLLVRYRYFV